MDDPQGLNYYQRLGVPEDATQEQLKAAHKAMVKQLHPDAKAGPYSSYFDELLKGVNEAYDTLKNPAKRAKYDQRLRYEREAGQQKQKQQQQEEARQRQRREEQKQRQEEERRRREEQQRQEREERRQAEEEARRRREEEADDEEYYWEEPGGAPHDDPRRESTAPGPTTTRPGPRVDAGAAVETLRRISPYVPWRAVALMGGALVVIFGAWSCMSAAFDSFETATRSVAQGSGKTEKAPAISAAELEEAEEELGEYFAAFGCSPCDADALTAAVEAHVSESFWESPNGRELQRSTAKVARGQELRQEFKLARFERNEPGPFAQWNEEEELRGTAYYDGRVIENGKDDGPIRGAEAKIRMQRTEAGGWEISYAS